MGKLVSLLLAGCGASAVSVGGVYLLRRADVAAVDAGSSQEESSAGAAPQKTLEEKGSLKFTTLEEFRSNKGYKCSVSMFSGKDLNLANLTNVGDFSNSESFLGTPATDKSKIKSCLVINWEKKTYSPDKWTGLFTWTWSFENENKGFVIVNIAKAETAGKLKLTGGAYLLEKKTDSETWEVKHGKVPVEEKELIVSNFEEKFPKFKADSGVSVGEMSDSNYWGFMKDKGDLAKICDSTSCSETAQATNIGPKVFEWVWQNGDKNISEWSENLNWWNYMYGDNNFNLGSSLTPFKGVWTKVTPSA